MPQKSLNKKIKISLILLFVLLLAIVRAYEEALFYDPFLDYFKSDYLNLNFPEFNGFQLFLGLSFRFFLNTILSLGIIYVLFLDIALTKFGATLYLFFYIVLITAFFLVVTFSDNGNNFILFYIRRFLIQPIFLLLFLPAFYYQKQNK